jgi:cation transport ATPase
MQGMDAAANEVEVEEIPGKGMKGTVQGRNTSFGESSAMIMIIGNESLMLENNVVISSASQKTLDAWKTQGKSIALAAITFNTSSLLPTYHLCAIISISDPIRPEAPGIITALQKRGTAVWMLSGDNQITANAVGSLVGIPPTNIIAGVLPHQKSEQIRYLQRSLKASGGKSETKRALIAMVSKNFLHFIFHAVSRAYLRPCPSTLT